MLTTVDVDLGDTHTYAIINQATNRFAISGTQLVVNNRAGLLLRETRLLTIEATDLTWAKVTNANSSSTSNEWDINELAWLRNMPTVTSFTFMFQLGSLKSRANHSNDTIHQSFIKALRWQRRLLATIELIATIDSRPAVSVSGTRTVDANKF